MPETPGDSVPQVQGIAGYLTPYPYLDKLQEKMEERLARRVPIDGRFCGFCYGRLRETDIDCPYCQTTTAERLTVSEIPQQVLQAFKAKQRTEATWVYMGAFVGLIIASIAFVWLEVWGPGILGHPATGFAVLIGGGYLLAQLTGPLIGGQYGYRNGARKRDALWAEFLKRRDR